MNEHEGKNTAANDMPTPGAEIYQFTPAPPSAGELAGAASLRRARRRRRLRRTAAGLAVVIGGSTGTAVAALSSGAAGQAPSLAAANLAASSASTAGSQPTTTWPANVPGPRRRERWGAGPGPAMPGVMRGTIVHGTYTVKTASGAYETVEVQNGTATSVNATTIEVTSPDGYAQSYAVAASTLVEADSSGITSVSHGDNVVVQATVSGTTVTAQRVVDLTQVGTERDRWRGGGGPRGAGPAPAA